MKRKLLLAIVVGAVMTGPSLAQEVSLAKMLEGKWTVDKDKSTKALNDSVGADQADEILSQFVEYSITFQQDGQAEVNLFGNKQNASWTILDEDKENKTLRVRVNVERRINNKDAALIKFIDENTISMMSGEEKLVMIFSRVEE